MRWLETFPPKLTPAVKQKVTADIVHNTYIFYDVIPDGDDHPLCKHWNASSKVRENMLAENPPIAHIGVTATKHTIVTHCPSLIKLSWNPHDESTSHPDATIGKKNEMAIVGFKCLDLHGMNAYDFSMQNLRNWVTLVSPKTKEAFTDTIPLTTMLATNATWMNKSSEKTCTLACYVPILPFESRCATPRYQ